MSTEIETAAEKAVDAAMASRKAVHAARDAQQSIEIAREAQMANAVAQAVKEVFSIEDDGGQKRYVDVSRVPLICQTIKGIDLSLNEIKASMVTQDQFAPVKAIAYGLVSITLTGVVGALLLLLFKR